MESINIYWSVKIEAEEDIEIPDHVYETVANLVKEGYTRGSFIIDIDNDID
jgi:hypothetical protein